MRRALISLACLVLVLAGSLQSQEQSLADQAAAVQNRKVARLDPDAVGQVVNGDYRNEHLGVMIKKLPNWQSMSRGEMNVTEGAARATAGVKGAIQSQSRVYGMQDLQGSTLVASIIPVPPGVDTSQIKAKLKAAIAAQLPNPQFSDEPVVLGDENHQFIAFRVSYELYGKQLYQSQQAIVQGDHLLALTLTTPTQEGLGTLWQSMKTNLIWTK
jgi:hypothetical protein